MVRQLRFHLHLSQRTDYASFLGHSLQRGRQNTVEELLLCAEHLAFLTNFHPDPEL